jgi:hypothetical protein
MLHANCGISFTLHGRVAGPSGFFRVADRWDARLMTTVCWFVGSLSRLVILDTFPSIGFFANLSDKLSMFCGENVPTNYSCLYDRCLCRHLLAFWHFFLADCTCLDIPIANMSRLSYARILVRLICCRNSLMLSKLCCPTTRLSPSRSLMNHSPGSVQGVGL